MKLIDLKEILKSKNPSLAKYIPRFIISFLERLIRVKEFNNLTINYGTLGPMGFIVGTLKDAKMTYNLYGAENIPQDRAIIFASNHPLGGLDGVALALGLNPYCPNGIKLIVNDLLLNIEALTPIFVPVNKHGAQGTTYFKIHQELYASDINILTFPAGLCSRLIKGKITDTPWKPNFVQKALKHNRLIVPIYVDGRNSMLFYRVAKLRTMLSIKSNLEMIFLPREVFRKGRKHLDIYVGEPIEITKAHSLKEWTQVIRDTCYGLKKTNNTV